MRDTIAIDGGCIVYAAVTLSQIDTVLITHACPAHCDVCGCVDPTTVDDHLHHKALPETEGFSSPTARYWDDVRSAIDRTSGRFPAYLLRLARRRMAAREGYVRTDAPAIREV